MMIDENALYKTRLSVQRIVNLQNNQHKEDKISRSYYICTIQFQHFTLLYNSKQEATNLKSMIISISIYLT